MFQLKEATAEDQVCCLCMEHVPKSRAGRCTGDYGGNRQTVAGNHGDAGPGKGVLVTTSVLPQLA